MASLGHNHTHRLCARRGKCCNLHLSPNASLVVSDEGCSSWWRHQMETFSTLLDICTGNSPVIGEFPAQKPQSFDAFFDLRLNKRLSKQWWGWWFETLSSHYDVTVFFFNKLMQILYHINSIHESNLDTRNIHMELGSVQATCCNVCVSEIRHFSDTVCFSPAQNSYFNGWHFQIYFSECNPLCVLFSIFTDLFPIIWLTIIQHWFI